MLVSLNNINKYFGDKLVFENVNVSIEERDRIGLIGINGVGKSTLLNIINKELSPDSGEVFCKSGMTIGFLRQNSGLQIENTIINEMKSVFSDVLQIQEKMRQIEKKMSSMQEHDDLYNNLTKTYSELLELFEHKDGYQIDVKIKTILNGMGFKDKSYNLTINSLSGGEKTRLALAKLLLEHPDLLILDEPTNHLDFKTLMWLEDYLKSYKGGLLVVSHDRYFLDKMVDKIWEIEQQELCTYKGNYTKYKKLKSERIIRQQKEYDIQQNKINSMLLYVDKNLARASTSNSAKSRLHQLDNLERVVKPVQFNETPKFKFEYEKSSVKDVLSVSDLSLVVGQDDELCLCKNINFEVKKGEKIAIIGQNGIGKSTLLKSLLNQIKQKGDIVWGNNVSISYYDQENQNLNPQNTMLDELWSRFTYLPEFKVRAILGQMLLTGDAVYKKVSVLSGGEKARLSLAIMMTQGANTLLFDEPTNHLDLQSKEALEKALIEFDGTLIFVSHDRYFLNKIPTKIIEMQHQQINTFVGGYDDYIEKSKLIPIVECNKKEKKDELTNSNFRSKQQRSEDVKQKREILRLENEIEQLDKEIAELEKSIALPEVAADYEKLTDFCAKLEDKKVLHENAFLLWAQMQE
ncbi:MAG: ABC-F family ATP-binding cassette domain-containing protein [Oscillospiraceae bacterium]